MARKNRRFNELKIDTKFLNVEGRSTKHHALIDHFANVNINKLREHPINLMGLDIETDHITGEMKLLGFARPTSEENWENYEVNYSKYNEHFLSVLFSKIRFAYENNYHFAHWNKLDPYQMFRVFLTSIEDDEQRQRSMLRYSKISGEWDRKNNQWDTFPVISVSNESWEFGILNAVRSSICFYYKSHESDKLKTVWAYDIGSLLPKTIAKEGERFAWYYKGAKEVHLVDWIRYNKDKAYQKEVDASNERDARCAMALGYEVQKDFNGAYEYKEEKAYPTSLVSQGALARSAVVAVTRNELIENGLKGKELQDTLYDTVTDIGIMKHYDRLAKEYGEHTLKDLMAIANESYSGGMIEANGYGYAKDGWYADLASAYPAYIEKLRNLKDCKIIKGVGEPPIPTEDDYIYIRGTVNIPESLQLHPITIKHPMYIDTNIRPTGIFKASYTWNERAFCKEYGATFKDEIYYIIKTKGEISALGKMVTRNVKLRDYFISINSSSAHTAKTVNASGYGITYECVPTYIETGELLPEMDGYRGGEFYNPFYASEITSRTRIAMSKACNEIQRNGGKIILVMTDSVTWVGKKEMLPTTLKLPFGETGIKAKKTLGWFETPEYVTDIVCLGSGRYGYRTSSDGKSSYENKTRGLNIVGFSETDGISVEKRFNWLDVLKLMRHYKSTNLKMNVRVLTSPAMVAHRNDMDCYDLGKIIEEERDVEGIAGRFKRIIDNKAYNPEYLSKNIVQTTAFHLEPYMFLGVDIVDGTLPILRNEMMKKTVITRKERVQGQSRKSSSKFYSNKYKTTKRKDRYNTKKKKKYNDLKSMGLDRDTCKKLSEFSWENIKKYFDKKGWKFKRNELIDDDN